MAITTTPGAKMIYLIKRRPAASHEELVMHWFANHMPGVIANQKRAAEQRRSHASRYIATLFDASRAGEYPWDGMANLWFPEPFGKPKVATGTKPRDSFQEKAEPYMPWATVEHVVIDGSDRLPVYPLTLNEPFPTTRSGFYKRCFLVKAKRGTDFVEFFSHWLEVHIPNVQAVMEKNGGIRYCVSLSIDAATEPYAGLAELYFSSKEAWKSFQSYVKPDGMDKWMDPEGSLSLVSQTEMIGIP